MAKGKEDKKPLKRHFSAGGAVYRKKNHTLEWLIIKPAKGDSPSKDRWQLPKGTIDTGEKSAETAEREVFEETGVTARVLKKLNIVRYFFVKDQDKIFKTVVFYLMKSDGGNTNVDPKWAHEVAEARWVTGDIALKLLSFKDDREVIKKAEEMVGK